MAGRVTGRGSGRRQGHSAGVTLEDGSTDMNGLVNAYMDAIADSN